MCSGRRCWADIRGEAYVRLQQGTFPSPPAPVGPREDFARLLRDAAEGLPVAGRVPTWEADRPKTLPVGEPVKVETIRRANADP